jgi:hypothetical protein
MSDPTERPSHVVLRSRFAVRKGAGVSRYLMRAYATDDGTGSDGKPATWKDIALFDSYNDVEAICEILNREARR